MKPIDIKQLLPLIKTLTVGLIAASLAAQSVHLIGWPAWAGGALALVAGSIGTAIAGRKGDA